MTPLSNQMHQEQERLNKLIADLDEKRAALDKEEEGIRQQLVAIDAYVNALAGKPTRSRKTTTRAPRRTGLKDQVLAILTSSPEGMKRADILESMGAKGDKSLENSISNTLNLLKKDTKLTLKDGVYKVPKEKKPAEPK
jgi:hypothetical protein